MRKVILALVLSLGSVSGNAEIFAVAANRPSAVSSQSNSGQARPSAHKPRRKGSRQRLGRWVMAGTRLDLPYPGMPWFVRYDGIAPAHPNAARGSEGVDSGAVAYGVGRWGRSYFAKKDLEERIQSGKTLSAPIWRQEDFAMMLLLPVDRRRMDIKARPVGWMLRLGVFGGDPPPDPSR